ncbi:MAG: hypothetical protein B7X55_13960 [Rhodobacterales bacterium 34-62-10]|nr:MAG: hypothetical protein B7X55_13960 [Rhodobacterales bacterium 34-62-10]
MLLGLAAASTAAATVASAEGHTAEAEAPELLSMGDALSDALTAYKDAAARVNRIADEWGPQWPVPDESIYRYGEGCQTHRDILGRGVQMPWGRKGVKRVHDLGTPEYFRRAAASEWAIYDRKMQTKSQRGAWSHKRWAEREFAAIQPAQEYWAEVDRITQASGIEAAKTAMTEARDALQDLVGRIVLFEERSITGLIIKAQAMQAWGEVDAFARAFHLDALAWADAMNETILRQTKFA